MPANNPRMIAKAAAIDADSILFDFEDAVPPDEKEEARQSLGSALRKADWGHRELGVRINAPGTPNGERDLAALGSELLISMLVVPKAESDLSSLGQATGKALIPIIETARGVMHVEDVFRSEGVVAVTYGAGDLATSVGGDVEAYGRNVFVKTLLVIAAAAYGLEAIDRVFFDLENDNGFRAEALEAKRLAVQSPHPVPLHRPADLARHRETDAQVRQVVLAGVDDQPLVADRAPALVNPPEINGAAQMLGRPKCK